MPDPYASSQFWGTGPPPLTQPSQPDPYASSQFWGTGPPPPTQPSQPDPYASSQFWGTCPPPPTQPSYGTSDGFVGSRPDIPHKHMFPLFMQERVLYVQNPDSDGNCGFRAVAMALGRNENEWLPVRIELCLHMLQCKVFYRQLGIDITADYNRIKWDLGYPSHANPDKWMEIPAVGHYIASKYNVAVVLVGEIPEKEDGNVILKPWSGTFVPLWSEPDVHARVICIIHVNGNHFMQPELANDCLLPAIDKFGRHEPGHRAWSNALRRRIYSANRH